MSKHKHGRRIQYAALPFRAGPDGNVQVLLITSRDTGRWVIPKGWPMRGKKPREAAAREAFEEAGVEGVIAGKRAVGSYHYSKALPDGEHVLCEVKVFLLLVERERTDFPEHGQRQISWLAPEAAAALVDEGGLSEIIRRTVGARFMQPRRRTN